MALPWPSLFHLRSRHKGQLSRASVGEWFWSVVGSWSLFEIFKDDAKVHMRVVKAHFDAVLEREVEPKRVKNDLMQAPKTILSYREAFLLMFL
ncbi:hypothetical protein BDQ17DRAFT_1542405 [Cyathus striatus]|nr:hypothetical protein BDQ17DRAFT_1542405 [Cyathus striatus]